MTQKTTSESEIKATVTRPPCKQCNGTGEVVFTKEKGGPICPSCGGNGYLTDEILCRMIASTIDHPSVYMGGPSHNSIRKAEQIIKNLKKEGLL
jgi:DnaJ-class molecular chaperone